MKDLLQFLHRTHHILGEGQQKVLQESMSPEYVSILKQASNIINSSCLFLQILIKDSLRT